jgi:hypothetical protein
MDPETKPKLAEFKRNGNPDLSLLSDRQREIVNHALGIRDGKPGYRNHFVTGEGSDDFDDCEGLVAMGIMERLHKRDWIPDYCYSVVQPELFQPTIKKTKPEAGKALGHIEKLKEIRNQLTKLREGLAEVRREDNLWKDWLTPCEGGITCVLASTYNALEEMEKHYARWHQTPE